MRYPDRIHIREVAPRDGLQGETAAIPTEAKVRLIDLLSAAGFPQINVTSFVSPKAVPQMADAPEVVARIRRRPGTLYDASVPNLKGAQRAMDAGIDAVVVFVAASDAGSRANVGRSSEESMTGAEELIRAVRATGRPVIGTIATAFGSPYEPEIPAERVLEMARRFVDAGATGLALGDTSGEADPRQVSERVSRLLERFPGVTLSLHFHDTRGLALANVIAAMDAGATHFDAAAGGIGGSPFTKNSAGNLATEDLVHMCQEMGIETGVDLDLVLEACRLVEQLVGHPLPGKLSAVGPSKRVAAV